jgi:hypothetical protein
MKVLPSLENGFSANPQSGWQHKAWGGAQRNPRTMTDKKQSPRSGRQQLYQERLMTTDARYSTRSDTASAVARFHGLARCPLRPEVPLRSSPGFMLLPAPRAKAKLTHHDLSEDFKGGKQL